MVFREKKDSNGKAERIIITVAKLILNNIHTTKFNCVFYSTRKDIGSCGKSKEWLPDYLKLFLENILEYTLKQTSIGQAVINAARPQSCIPQSMHCCADIHNSMCNLTGLQHRSSKQYVKMGVTRRKLDIYDLRKIHAWCNKHNRFVSNN